MTVSRKFYVLTNGTDVLTTNEDDLPVMYETKEQAEFMAFDDFEPKEVELSYEVQIGNIYTKSCFQDMVDKAHKVSRETEKKMKESKMRGEE